MARMTNTSFMTGIKNWVLGKIANIMALIPNQASSSNQLADKNFVNSSIATATATFRGTYNVVSDLSLSYNATHAQIEAALVMKMAALSIVADNNDYAFVQIPTSDATPTEIAMIEKYKYDGTAWAFEYELNNSGFTAAQWAAINSGATLELIGKLSALPTNAELITILNSKASKAANPTAGHLASLDGSGNPTDSGVGIEDNGAYDVTLHNNNAKFASLSELLNSANLNTLIPVDKRYGGMSIKFVQSSDNKYVQYFLTKNTWNTDIADWEKVNLEAELDEKVGQDEIIKMAEIYDDDEQDDLNFGDENGNIILSLKNGHIKTKNFNSEDLDLINAFPLKNKKIAFLGDSITGGTGASSVAHRYVTLVGNYTQAIPLNYGVGGTCIAKQSANDNNAFEERCKSIASSSDLILVLGGVNDFASGTIPFGTYLDGYNPNTISFCAGMFRLCKNLKDTFPNTPIIISTPIHYGREYVFNNDGSISRELTNATSEKTFREYVSMIKEVAGFFAIPVVDAFNESGLNYFIDPSDYTDPYHPADSGHLKIAKYLANQITFIYKNF